MSTKRHIAQWSLNHHLSNWANILYWNCTLMAQLSHIRMWLVVSRETYGECMRLFCGDSLYGSKTKKRGK